MTWVRPFNNTSPRAALGLGLLPLPHRSSITAPKCLLAPAWAHGPSLRKAELDAEPCFLVISMTLDKPLCL